MKFITAAQISIAFSMLLCRFLVITSPQFLPSLEGALILNVLCGLASDVSVVALIWIFLELLKIPKARSFQIAVALTSFLLVVITFGSLAAHIRYLQHFGTTIQPFHFSMMDGGVWYSGIPMILESTQSVILFFSSISLFAALVWFGLPIKLVNRFSRISIPKRLVFCALLATAANASVVQLRTHPMVQKELRYNPLTALYYNLKFENKKLSSTKKATPQELIRLRELFDAEREFFDAGPSDYPMWQRKVSAGSGSSPKNQKIRSELRTFLKEEADKHGPWNIVMLMVESMRANEIESFGKLDHNVGVTPKMTEIFGQGIRFTEMWNTGRGTRHGTAATQCGIPAVPDFAVMVYTPTTKIVCLTDIFSALGYSNHFFFAADNNFDNQGTFYRFHRTQSVYDENDFAENSVRGGWGYTDKELYNFTLANLAKAPKPFYATVLTMTYHPPMELPVDEALKMNPKWNINQKTLHYVDKTFGDFYAELTKKFPHTIFLTVADHGQMFEDPVIRQPKAKNLDYLRMINRIPFVINIPGMPESLKGQVVESVSSNIDIPPTLLSLLGHENVPQQFFGTDLFSRTKPVFLNWFEQIYTIGTSLEISDKFADQRETLKSAAMFGSFVPPGFQIEDQ